MFPYNSVCVGNEFMELTHGNVKVEEQTCRFTGLDLDICLSNIDTTSSVSFGHPSKSLGNVFIYSGRRFYQFNEDDFLIKFLFLPIFQKAWIHIKWCTFKWIVLPVYWYCTKCFICTIICFVLFRYWYCTRCIYCTAKCLVLSIYWCCSNLDNLDDYRYIYIYSVYIHGSAPIYRNTDMIPRRYQLKE